ncbi:NYN domain-containing protein [Acidobacteria bacterium AH-259-A15]|nr:NYN domain-containing protein [Acidobacteria bacterium AH-259-A15]
MAEQHVVLFVDAQNLYRGARRAFFRHGDSHTYGQVNPVALGRLICSRPRPGYTRILTQVRVYTGRPDASKQPRTYAAHRKQCAAWEAFGARVIFRPLRYPLNWPGETAQEKGIDVALAIDYIAFAIDGHYDVGIIASTDTDLKPALEFVYRRFRGSRKPEVMAWTSARRRPRLSIAGANLWCHWLDRQDYDSIADLTDYST